MFPKKKTPAQLAAARRNLAKARSSSAKKKRTPAQIAASKRNIKKALEARKGKPLTPKQRAAAIANLAKARAALKAKRGFVPSKGFRHRDVLRDTRKTVERFKKIKAQRFKQPFRRRTVRIRLRLRPANY